jgi:tyrosyl-tRNA synthetase
MALAVTASRHGEAAALAAQASAVGMVVTKLFAGSGSGALVESIPSDKTRMVAGGDLEARSGVEGGKFSTSTASERSLPEASLAAVNFPAKAFYLLSALGLCASSSEARRQIQGGGVRLDGEKLVDPNQEFADAAALAGKVLQLGKKTFRRLVAEGECP